MSSAAVVPMALDLGPWEIILILVVLVLLFGAKKLPDLARGTGQALRIFKAETKNLLDDDDKSEEQKQIDAQRSTPPAAPVEDIHQTRPVETPAEPPRSDTDR